MSCQVVGTRIEKFGVTIDRFKKKKEQQPQNSINPHYPIFKTKSKARQEEVGFGRTTNQDRQEKSLHNGVFYEDTNNLENVSKGLNSKMRSKKVGF